METVEDAPGIRALLAAIGGRTNRLAAKVRALRGEPGLHKAKRRRRAARRKAEKKAARAAAVQVAQAVMA